MRSYAFIILMIAACLSAVSSSRAEDGELKWKYQTGDDIYFFFLVPGSDGTVYVGSGDNHLRTMTCSLTASFAVSAGETVVATFWMPIEDSEEPSKGEDAVP